jgi:hypothetical protein
LTKKVVSDNIVAVLAMDYATVAFPFTRISCWNQRYLLFDEKVKKTFVTSKYAVTFKRNTDLIDLQGSVKVTNRARQWLKLINYILIKKTNGLYRR